jgi:SNF2 family DNA or RNA helicase
VDTWFSINGSLELDNKEVIDMQVLLDLLSQNQGRFIKMNDGSFLALTNSFRKQLDELNSFSETTKNGLRFSPLISPLIDDITAQAATLEADKAWKSQIEKIKEIKNFKLELPSTFQATLREYQQEGFDCLTRLAHWGVGACLADDMGLGKTIQSLAVLVTKAESGPSLVIAPSSVCMNWHTESNRYAPTLNVIQFGGKNRNEMLKNLKPYDLLVCSYGMIQQADAAESLQSIQWQVVILDEAQAIKNMATKRSQAVMNLKAEFRLLTTGTPIENHLGELWNLFRF